MRIHLDKQDVEYSIGVILILIMGLFPSSASKIAYFHFLLTIVFLFFSIGKEPLNKAVYKQVLLFGLLAMIALFGCMREYNFFSIRNVGALICLAFFIAWYANGDSAKLNNRFILSLFTLYLILLTVLFQFYSPRENHTGNLYAGFICFISCSGNFLFFQQTFPKRNIWLIIYVFLTVYLLFVTQGRTGLATYIFIWLFYFSSRFFTNKKLFKCYFWVMVILLVTLIGLYIHLPEFSWYRSVNKYSVALFDKNLNSSRGTLWLNELSRLGDYRWVNGLGTGTLPSMERYANSSAHSSYIQMLVQNGIMGLLVLLSILYNYWKRFASHLEDKPTRFALSVLFGIMLYNCFEVTLLQNKISVGITEWFILCLAISRIKFLECNQRRKTYDTRISGNGE